MSINKRVHKLIENGERLYVDCAIRLEAALETEESLHAKLLERAEKKGLTRKELSAELHMEGALTTQAQLRSNPKTQTDFKLASEFAAYTHDNNVASKTLLQRTLFIALNLRSVYRAGAAKERLVQHFLPTSPS